MSERNGEFIPQETGFRMGSNGRPEGTSETDQGVIHYTCNAPDKEILREMGIMSLGENFGVGENEVLLIPDNLFEERGIEKKGTVEAEALLRDLSQK